MKTRHANGQLKPLRKRLTKAQKLRRAFRIVRRRDERTPDAIHQGG